MLVLLRTSTGRGRLRLRAWVAIAALAVSSASPQLAAASSPRPIGGTPGGPGSGAGAQAVADAPATVWMGPDGEPLPFRDESEVVHFLTRARVVNSVLFGAGTTGLKRLDLELDGVRARAAFHIVNERQRDVRVGGQFFRTFHDSYRGQCAAYALARLLELDNVPPAVCRVISGDEGSVQLWVEDAMSEEDRAQDGVVPPSSRTWMIQMQRMRMFDNLIYNDDRHANNFMYDDGWRLWLIDHTRAFQTRRALRYADELTLCERGVWARLQAVTDDEIRDAVRSFLDQQQLGALVDRRKLVIEHIRTLIDERGEDAVLVDDV